jgi:hypothetical protein
VAEEGLKVTFGAETTEFVSGVKQVGTEAKSLAALLNETFAHMGEGIRIPLDALAMMKSSLRETAEVAGIVYAVDKLKELTSWMAEVGEHAVNMGAALGMSAEQFQQLNEAMGLVGASGDDLVRAERMLSRVAEEAIAQPISHVADAFKALGIDATQFAATLRANPIEALKQLADAAVKTGNTSLTGPLGFLLGRGGGADMLRFFSEGASGIDKMIAKVKELGSPTQEMLEGMEKIARTIHEMTTAMENFGLAIGGVVSGPLEWFMRQVTEFYSITGKWVAGNLHPQPGPGAEGRGMFGDVHDVPGATEEERRQLQDIRERENAGSYTGKNPSTSASGAYQMIDETWRRWAQAVGIRTDRYPTAQDAPDAMQDVAALHGLRTEGLTPWKASEGHSKLSPLNASSGIDAGTVEVKAKAPAATKTTMGDSVAEKKAAEDQIKAIDEETKAREAQLNFEIVAAKGNADVVHTLEQQKIATVEEAENRKRAVINSTSGAVKDALEKENSAITEGINLQTQALRSDQQYNQQAVENANRLLEVQIKGLNATESEDLRQVEQRQRYGQMTAQQAEEAERQIVTAHQKAVDEILQQEEKNAQGIAQIQQKVAAQRVEIEQQTAQKLKAIDDRYQDEKLQKEQQVNQTIASDLNNALWSVITRQSTLIKAFEDLGKKLGEALSQNIMTSLATAINPAGMLGLGGSGGSGGILGSLLGSGGMLSGLFGGASDFSGGITGAGTAVAGGGFTDFLTTAASFLPFLGFAHGGIVPSAAGGWAIPSFQSGGLLAQLHSGEMVLPADLSEGMQGMIRSGGGGGGTINIHAIDTQAGSQFLMKNRNTIGQAFRNASLTGGLSSRQLSNGRGSTGRF